jgi:nicotinamidase/pyrazinamidase
MMKEHVDIAASDALLIVDVQNDFISGTMAIPGSPSILPIINRLIAQFQHVIVAHDWHPPGHISFASAHAGAKPGDTVTTPYGAQRVFPDHCVQGTPGAELDVRLELAKAELILRKGYRASVDSYSAFFENDQTTVTGLAGYLRARGIERVFCVGLALFGCVKATAEGARKEQLESFIITDASKGRETPDGSHELAAAELRAHGVGMITSAHLRAP